MKQFLRVKKLHLCSRACISPIKYLLYFLMADWVVVVVDSRCWALVARATAAMALRPHQGNCCYPPALFPPPPFLRTGAAIGWMSGEAS